MPVILDGKALAEKMAGETVERVARLKDRGIETCLAVILVGDDPASAVYVRSKKRMCKKLGIKSESFTLSAETSQDVLIDLIHALNDNRDVHGILVQLPLPKHINEYTVMDAISPDKDADGFHVINQGKLLSGRDTVLPCTPAGCIALLKEGNVPLNGADAVVIGRSNIVGKPVSLLLQRENCTVTMCHSRTKDISKYTRNADIVVSAVGKPGLIKSDMIKEGAAVVDVGINRVSDGVLTGDVDFEECASKAGYITPVPGGVGPMTIAMLMRNTVILAEKYADR